MEGKVCGNIPSSICSLEAKHQGSVSEEKPTRFQLTNTLTLLLATDLPFSVALVTRNSHRAFFGDSNPISTKHCVLRE